MSVAAAAAVVPVGGSEVGEGAVGRAEAEAVQHWSAVEESSRSGAAVAGAGGESVGAAEDVARAVDEALADEDEDGAGAEGGSEDGSAAAGGGGGVEHGDGSGDEHDASAVGAAAAAAADDDDDEAGAAAAPEPHAPVASAGDSDGGAGVSGELDWEPVYHTLVSIEKVLRAPALRAVQLPAHVIALFTELALYPHTWVRLAANRALARVLAVGPDVEPERRIVGGVGAWLANSRTQFATVRGVRSIVEHLVA